MISPVRATGISVHASLPLRIGIETSEMVFALNASGIANCGTKLQAGELTGDVEFVVATIDSHRVIIGPFATVLQAKPR